MKALLELIELFFRISLCRIYGCILDYHIKKVIKMNSKIIKQDIEIERLKQYFYVDKYL